MQRVKNIEYDADDVYSDEGDDFGDEAEGTEYTAEDKDNFASLTPVVRAELEEAGLQASDRAIEDALWHYFWDVGKSVTYLKTSQTPRPQPQVAKKETKPKSKFDEAAAKSAEKSGSKGVPKQSATSNLIKKTETLKLGEPTASAAAPPKTRSKGMDVPKLWREGMSTRKASAAFVVIGHVDHGKSTLMGRLLLDTGAVAQRDVDRFQKQATELGKSSFALAWVMDTGSEERERGVTVDIAQHHFSTQSTDFTILDAPGHRDFVPNMIGGASMADIAMLVVDANQLESGMKGQTREHVLLAKAVGLKRVIVAVNKLDCTIPDPWSQETFEEVNGKVVEFLRESGYIQSDIVVVPCSGLHGENVARKPSEKGAAAWVAKTHMSLLEALEQSAAPLQNGNAVGERLRMQVTDVFRGGVTNPLSVAGRIRSGNVQVGDAVLVQPSGEPATIKGVDIGGEPAEWAAAGQICTLHLTDIDPIHLRVGDVICGQADPIAVVKVLTATVETVDTLLPQSVDVHFGRLHVPGSITQLVCTIDDKGEMVKKKPRMLKAGQKALVRVSLEEGVPVEGGGRVVLRTQGATVAWGVVE